MSAKTLLVVDDESYIRHMLQIKLAKAGYSILTASNGEQAFRLACENHPHLLVTDFQMPGGDGLTLCQRLKSNAETTDIPAIMLTARGHRVPPEELRKTNIQHLMAKPFSVNELSRKVKDVLARVDDQRGSEAA